MSEKAKGVTVKSTSIGDLESDVCDMERAAILAAHYVSDLLSVDDATVVSITGNRDLFYLPAEQRDVLVFAAYEVQRRAKELKEGYYEALEGKTFYENRQR